MATRGRESWKVFTLQIRELEDVDIVGSELGLKLLAADLKRSRIGSRTMYWTVHNEGGPRRVNHATAAVGHLIYSFGGYCTGDNYSIQRPIDIHVLNPTTFRWKSLSVKNEASLTPFQRYGHTVISYGHYIYLWGGRNDENACKVIYRFDTKTLKWEKPPVSGAIPGARDGHSAVVIRNQMFVFGGYEEEVGLFSQDVYSLNLKTLEWSFVPAAGMPPSFRDFHTATVYLDRYMIVFGGRGDVHGPLHTRSELYCNTLVCLDVERQEWYRPPTSGIIPAGRRSHSTFMHNGYMYMFGGYNGASDQHFNDFYRYDPESGEWKELRPFGMGPAPRRRQGCVVLDNKVFFFGGTSPVVDEAQVDEDVEESSLIDHDDLFVLDMDPTLKTLCLLKIIEKSTQLDTTVLPRDLRHELSWMVTRNQLTTLASG